MDREEGKERKVEKGKKIQFDNNTEIEPLIPK
jgi:hypothetical protein